MRKMLIALMLVWSVNAIALTEQERDNNDSFKEQQYQWDKSQQDQRIDELEASINN